MNRKIKPTAPTLKVASSNTSKFQPAWFKPVLPRAWRTKLPAAAARPAIPKPIRTASKIASQTALTRIHYFNQNLQVSTTNTQPPTPAIRASNNTVKAFQPKPAMLPLASARMSNVPAMNNATEATNQIPLITYQ